MHYKITKQFPRQQETDCARFINEADAKVAINALFAADYKTNPNIIYRLFDKYGDVVVELDGSKDKPDAAASAGANESAGAGSSQTSGFRPTPFSTTPTPPGGPKKWTTLPEDEDKDEKK